jgi:hypothetical protein
MATITQVTSNGAPKASGSSTIKDIWVSYDEANDGVILDPDPLAVNKDTTARFRDPNGGKLRIVFLSPTGKETDEVLDSETYTLTVGGTYHFKCFFIAPGSTTEKNPKNGGVIDVIPQRP